MENQGRDLDSRILAALQDGLPASRTPYDDLARRIGIPTSQLLEVLGRWKRDGRIRRIGAVVNHFQVGLAGGAMVVWKVQSQRVEQVGAVFAGFDEVSHAYERQTAPGWEFNLYAMVHGTTAEAVEKTVERMSRAAGVDEYVVLTTRKELKKVPPTYVPPVGVGFEPTHETPSRGDLSSHGNGGHGPPCEVASRATSDERRATPHTRVLRLLFWESTIRCNLACAHCRRLESNEAAAGDLSTSDARRLIEQLAELGRRQPQMPVLVFSGGEPLCREDLFDLIGCARQEGIVPALATNGTMIDGTMAQQILDSGVARVSVSLDGATAEVHDRMRQIPGSFDAALRGLGHLRGRGVPFQINMTLTRQNAGQLEQVYDLARSLGAVAVHIFMLVPVGCGETLAETDMLSPQGYEEVMRNVYLLEGRGQIQIKVTCGPHYERVKRQMENVARRSSPVARGATAQPAVPGASRHGGHSRGCLAGLGVLFVSHRGDVYPCGYLPVHCGNVLNETLTRIWDQSEDLARMRDVEALEGKCGVCEYKRVCGGCRGRAFAATGNYMAEEPFCSYIPLSLRPDVTG